MAAIIGFAVIDGPSGNLIHQFGVDHIEHPETGLWRVFFTNSIANACEVASIANSETMGVISAYGDMSFGDGVVSVFTNAVNTSSDGDAIEAAPADLTFQLLVVA